MQTQYKNTIVTLDQINCILLKQLNTDVFNTTSNADELKKYADLRDQGIITEEEFQAKKKKLLDL